MPNEPITWVVTYEDKKGDRVALQWNLTEDEAEELATIAASLDFEKPRAERADMREP